MGVIFASLYWVIESVIHQLVFHEHDFEFIPTDPHELWMRSTVTILLILFGVVNDVYSKMLLKKEAQKKEVYLSMLRATKHILHNFLNKMTLFQIAAEDSKDFDKEILDHYQVVIKYTTDKIKDLEGIDDPQKESIEERYLPK